MEKASLAVIIGRWQLPHLSHKHLIKEASKIADNVLILCGSANSAQTIKNPFTMEQRRDLLAAIDPNVYVQPISDFHYNDDLWIAQVQEKVVAHCAVHGIQRDSEIVMVGNYTDDSSYYLQYFPQWKKKSIPGIDGIHAAELRKLYFDPNVQIAKVLKHIPEEIHSFIKEFRKSDLWAELSKEMAYIDAYKASWSKAPFPVTFVTADAIVTAMGHVLVVKRKTHPGKGLYAAPGGFIKADEFIEDAALRELKEETGIRVDKPVLRRCIVDRRVFDYPSRSLRGRTITHAFHIRLEGKDLPEVRGADDAEHAFWMPFVEVFQKSTSFFEDHGIMIQSFIARY